MVSKAIPGILLPREGVVRLRLDAQQEAVVGGSRSGVPGPEELGARVRHLERELGRVRRSRRVLMDLLWRLDRDWRRRLDVLEAENRRLWSVRRTQGPA